jgi:hypothetical protein
MAKNERARAYELMGVGFIPLHRQDGSLRAWTVVDEADFEEIAAVNWSMAKDGYVLRNVQIPGGRYQEYLARRIMGLERGDPRVPDHIDRDKLNNRRSNLRVATLGQNNQNRSPRHGQTSQFRGVSWAAGPQKWYACICVNGKTQNLGLYADELVAAQVARDARRELLPYAVD